MIIFCDDVRSVRKQLEYEQRQEQKKVKHQAERRASQLQHREEHRIVYVLLSCNTPCVDSNCMVSVLVYQQRQKEAGSQRFKAAPRSVV
jgi:hypothetical protein